MTENYFGLAILLVFIHLTMVDGWMIRVAIVACVVLGLLSGYGVLPAWQG